MKQNYILRLFLCFGVSTLLLTACGEKEDMVSPKETCGTMATVQYQEGSGLELELENGQILRPENVKQLSADKRNFAIDGFAVKAGQQILIGYNQASQQGAGGKTVKVNCIVGLSPQ
jgi:exopolysaccharide biosynthesis protein